MYRPVNFYFSFFVLSQQRIRKFWGLHLGTFRLPEVTHFRRGWSPFFLFLFFFYFLVRFPYRDEKPNLVNASAFGIFVMYRTYWLGFGLGSCMAFGEEHTAACPIKMRSIFFRRLIVTALWELTFFVWIPKLRVGHESSIVYRVL